MMEWWHICILFVTALIAGFVDSIAGGGGLLTLPVLLNVCADPFVAFGTNKLQASFGSTSATFHFARGGALSFREVWRSCLLAFTGALCGTYPVQQVDTHWIEKIVPLLLIGVALVVWLRPELGREETAPRISRLKFDLFLAFGIGFYDGFLGPGTGTFLAMAYMLFLGLNMPRATANAKALNWASNIASLLMYLISGKILFAAGLFMGVGQWIGARAGSEMVLKRGTSFIRPIFLTMVLLITLKLVYKSYLKPMM